METLADKIWNIHETVRLLRMSIPVNDATKRLLAVAEYALLEAGGAEDLKMLQQHPSNTPTNGPSLP